MEGHEEEDWAAKNRDHFKFVPSLPFSSPLFPP